MLVRWTPPAADDLEQIHTYLSIHLPGFAAPTVRRIYDSARSLRTNPNRGRPGLRPGTRELVLSPLPYIVVYRVNPQAVEILHIHHAAQDRI